MKGKVIAKILESELTKKVVSGIVKNAPKILTGSSIASSIVSVGFAVKGTILAVEIEKQRKAKIESGEIPQPEHPKLAVIKSVWKCYIPAFTFLTVSCGTALYGTSISTARTAMATAACKASELAFEEYRTKMIEELGAEKEKEIRQKIEKDRVETASDHPPIVAPFEKYLCQEMYTGSVFYSNLYDIKDAFLEMNYKLLTGNDELSFMEYLGYFDLDSKEEEIGWNVSMSGLLVLSYHSEYDAYGRPVIVFGPTQRPYENYNIYG